MHDFQGYFPALQVLEFSRKKYKSSTFQDFPGGVGTLINGVHKTRTTT